MYKKCFVIPKLVKLFTVIIFTIVSAVFLLTNYCTGEEIFKAVYSFEITLEENTTGAFNQPAGITLDSNGVIYVADTINSRVVVLDAAGKVKAIFGKQGEGASELKAPMALTVNSKTDKVYVADSSNYRIQVFKTNGEYISAIDLNQNIEEGLRRIRPIGIAVSSDGNIYISDADNNYLRVYSSSGEPLFKFGGFGAEDGKFCIPVGVFIDKHDKVYVVDMNNSRVQVFDKQGKFLFKIGSAGDTKGSFGKPKDVCVDNDGFIYVSDGANLIVQVFDQKGNFIDLIGAEKDVDLQFASPFGVAVYKSRLYITDRWRNSVRVYEIKS